jgi:hypothetical protein
MRSHSATVRWLGYIFFAAGALSLVQSVIEQLWLSKPPDIGLLFAGGSIALTGLLGLSVGSCLNKLDDRVKRLEQIQVESRSNKS